MWIAVITLFPKMFRAITDYGIVGRAIKRGLLSIKFWNPREFSSARYGRVDDYLYGGGSGMLMMVQPLRDAISCAKSDGGTDNIKVIYLSPQGKKLDQNGVYEFLHASKLILVCGRYKGIDERLIRLEIDEEWSIGDYVLSGGELAAMVLIDAVSRFIPGVLNQIVSAEEDTFCCNNSMGILSPPHYTRPSIFEGISVPRVLLSGDHDKICQWRLKQSLGWTWVKRPELLKSIVLSPEAKRLLFEFKYEFFMRLINELH
ncbi:tRNA (guanosine(37)-N1)-methyltransferase TrmD [Blochmannia endosymbiont of Polyrhachis (Hedomyrma) turneri]|uniref:tRNA (guanosine(37)-N1)-methyltransferase TrmD n=1 Tax=Blochmannia endosymbiont of Polyrhachis (Hedomyrma) turneri TaxID=1505596 RepID=UPI00061A6B41|nr:tRNA (guanosine(37)-N1)-methyltransferase TrmD [Blochmannia endosymbiont of Polyrhachis (Hedomyrma) turneri]AKC59757.1 tRNA (guanine-N(1)-)-methyltransferase [Blochmannia endosymbiont of Polyrhachis (Hedomyrma) turneri]